MKVILLRDVAKIGRRNEIVDVPDGYAFNQLIPKKWAEPATPANLKKIANANALSTAHNDAEQAQFDAVVAQLQKEMLTIEGEPNAQGHLFKAVHEQDVVTSAKAQGITIDKSWIHIETSIKSLGSHEIVLKRGPKKVVCLVEVIKKIK